MIEINIYGIGGKGVVGAAGNFKIISVDVQSVAYDCGLVTESRSQFAEKSEKNLILSFVSSKCF